MTPIESSDYTPTDSFFGAPYIDVDEQRSDPLPHRYVHGGFDGTDTRFSFYFPPAEQYAGRFLHFLEGGHGGNENALSQRMNMVTLGYSAFNLAFEELGAYLVESNQGHLGMDLSGTKGDISVQWWRASAESARYAREVAAEMYGDAPHHGYVWGGSGGGYRSPLCLENAPDVYDGAVPFVFPTEGIVFLSAWAYGVEGLLPKLAEITDAVEPGGSGDPFERLSFTERDTLQWLYRAGYPRGAEPQLRRELVWGFGLEAVRDNDPEYFDDFWTVPGYAGADDPAALAGRLVEATATVVKTLTPDEITDNLARILANSPDSTLGIAVDHPDPTRLFWCKATITSGKAAGRHLYIAGVNGDVLTPYPVGYPEFFNGVEPGDEITFDNRDFVAFCHYWRHTGPTPEHHELAVDGNAVWPVRPRQVDRWVLPRGDGLSGKFEGKMIVCNGALDIHVFIPCAYPRMVRDHLDDRTDEHFRMWWMANASHSGPDYQRPGEPAWKTRIVDYAGYTNQALRDVVAWVEHGVAPPHMQWEIDADNALVLPDDAATRGGIQPVAHATANGATCAEVKVGEPVTLRATATVPPGTGTIVVAAWDFDESATWPHHHPEADGSSDTIDVTVTHTYDAPGTYFAAFRVGSHRDGADGNGPAVENLARARVVVSNERD